MPFYQVFSIVICVLTQQQVLWICQNFGFDTWDHHRWQTPSQNKDDPEKLMLDPLYLFIEQISFLLFP